MCGMRWKVESTISDLKRMFGESARSRDTEHMAKEVDMRISLFNQLKGIRGIMQHSWSVDNNIIPPRCSALMRR